VIRYFFSVMDFNHLPPTSFAGALSVQFSRLILSQHSRTQYAADALDESLDKMTKMIFREKLKAIGMDIDKVKVGWREPAIMAFGMAIGGYPLLWDMRYKLLINETDEEFIISDNPVVFCNQLMEFRTFGSNCGMACKGLQIFAPIDPRTTLVMFDPTSYRVGGTALTVRVTNPRDVYELNTLQFVSASSNIYFRNPTFNAAALHRKAAPYLRTQKNNVTKSPEQIEPRGRRTYIITTSSEDVRTNLRMSSITVRGSAKTWLAKFRKDRYQAAVVVRNEFLVKAHGEFEKATRNGEYQAQDFRKFLEKRLGRRIGSDDNGVTSE
jgi:hypothetical protein